MMTVKLSPQQLEEVMVELRAGTSHTVIAKQFKISKALVHQINEGERRCYRIDGMVYPIKNKEEERRLEDLEFRNRDRPDERHFATVALEEIFNGLNDGRT